MSFDPDSYISRGIEKEKKVCKLNGIFRMLLCCTLGNTHMENIEFSLEFPMKLTLLEIDKN